MPLSANKIKSWEKRTSDAEFFATCNDKQIEEFMEKFRRDDGSNGPQVRFIPFRDEWDRRNPSKKIPKNKKFGKVPN